MPSLFEASEAANAIVQLGDVVCPSLRATGRALLVRNPPRRRAYLLCVRVLPELVARLIGRPCHPAGSAPEFCEAIGSRGNAVAGRCIVNVDTTKLRQG